MNWKGLSSVFFASPQPALHAHAKAVWDVSHRLVFQHFEFRGNVNEYIGSNSNQFALLLPEANSRISNLPSETKSNVFFLKAENLYYNI